MNRYLFKEAVLLDTLLAAGLAFGLAISMPGFAADVAAPPGGGTFCDAGITANVKQRVASIQSLKRSDIRVSTTDGVVTLSGTVSDPHAKFAAVAAVVSMEGIRVLDDELKTPPGKPMAAQTRTTPAAVRHGMPDERVTANVKEALAAQVSGRFKVGVTTSLGVVFLSGDLPSQDAAEHGREVVAKVDGVKSVNMNGIDTPFVTMTY